MTLPPSHPKIRWGILGAAAIAESQVGPAIEASHNGVVAAVASRDLSRAQRLADKFPEARAYDNYEAMLESGEIDAVYNPLPNSLHAKWSLACLEHDLPVLVEKPMAVHAEEAEEVVRAFEDRGVALAEGFMYRFHPLTRGALEVVESGRIGEVVMCRASFTTPMDDPSDIRLNRHLGGGVLRDLGCYCVGILRHLLSADPEEVKAIGRWGEKSQVDEAVGALLRFPSGAIGLLGCSFGAAFTCEYEVIGTRGRLLVDRGGMVTWGGEAFKLKIFSADGDEERVMPPENPYRLMVEDFADALTYGRPVRFSPKDSVANMRVIDAILNSAAEGRWS